jgi:hypothetical protein
MTTLFQLLTWTPATNWQVRRARKASVAKANAVVPKAPRVPAAKKALKVPAAKKALKVPAAKKALRVPAVKRALRVPAVKRVKKALAAEMPEV